MQRNSCQHRGKNISKRNYEITEVILLIRFIFPDENCKDISLNLIFPFLKKLSEIWEWGVWDHVIQIAFRVMNFQDKYSKQQKVKKSFIKHLLHQIQFLFSRNSYVCSIMDFYILILIRHKFTVQGTAHPLEITNLFSIPCVTNAQFKIQHREPGQYAGIPMPLL